MDDTHEGQGIDTGLAEALADRDLGGLDGPVVRRAAAQVGQVDLAGAGPLDHPERGVGVETAVRDPVRQHQHRAGEPVAADVRRLPGLVGVRRGQRGHDRPALLGTAEVAAAVGADEVQRRLVRRQPGRRPGGQGCQVEVQQLVGRGQHGGGGPRRDRVGVRREDAQRVARRRSAPGDGSAGRGRRRRPTPRPARAARPRRSGSRPAPSGPRARRARRGGTSRRRRRCPPSARPTHRRSTGRRGHPGRVRRSPAQSLAARRSAGHEVRERVVRSVGTSR